jgi:hypothetical protein
MPLECGIQVRLMRRAAGIRPAATDVSENLA